MQTSRLTLGPFSMAHFEAFAAFCETERSVFLGGPTTDRRDAWDSCMIHLGQWQARGYGAFFATETATGRPAGRISIWHPITLDEPELSWMVFGGFEGKGFATEGARAVRDWAAAQGMAPLMSLVAPENGASVRLAQRLGCTEEGRHTYPSGAEVIRFRHPLGGGCVMATMLPNVPVLETERLILRGPAVQDIEPVIAFYADPVRSAGFGGPLKRDDAWRWFALSVGHWCLHGYGFWTVETKTGEIVGIVGIWNPEGWPEPELGWVMFENGEGKGYAFEAAKAVRDYAYDVLGMTTMSSNILPSNERSKALARKMGAVYECTYDNPNMGTDELWRHPGPEARA